MFACVHACDIRDTLSDYPLPIMLFFSPLFSFPFSTSLSSSIHSSSSLIFSSPTSSSLSYFLLPITSSLLFLSFCTSPVVSSPHLLPSRLPSPLLVFYCYFLRFASHLLPFSSSISSSLFSCVYPSL